MVAGLSVGKDTDNKTKAIMQGKIRICQDLMKSLGEGVDKDVEAFNKVMEAYKMPKMTAEEKKVRSEAIQEALIEAAEQPYEMALLCLDVMNMAVDMLKSGNRLFLATTYRLIYI
jgi:formiminotetrahydrofolate cyclodeaminase